jgi:hypothetical protein
MSVIIFFGLSLLILTACLLWARRQQAAFEERFPPISDEEFIARCARGTDALVALRVRRVLAESLCVEYERIYPSSRLVQDLGAD